MSAQAWFWIIIVVWVASMVWYGLQGRRVGRSLEGYTIARGTVKAREVAWSVTTAITSPATFLGVAGFAYLGGLSSLWWLIVVPTAFAATMLIIGPRFKRVAHAFGVLSLPDWLGRRYQSSTLQVIVSFLYLLNIFYLIGQWSGIGLTVVPLTGAPYEWALIGSAVVLLFYVFFGGNFAVIKTDVIQGYIMVVASISIVVAGFFWFDGLGDLNARLASQSDNFVRPFNPEFGIFASPLAVLSLAVFWIIYATQPHVAGRFLVLREQRDMRKFILISWFMTFVFVASMMGGLYARALGLELEQPDTANLEIASRLPGPFGALVYVGIIAAALSTISVVIITLATVVGNDLYLRLGRYMRRSDRSGVDESQLERRAVLIGRIVVVALVILTVALAFNPPPLIGVFVAIGIYGFFAGVAGPLIIGLYWRKATAAGAIAAAVLGPAFHLILYYAELIPNVFIAGAFSTLFGFVVMYVVSLATSNTAPQDVVDLMFEEQPLQSEASNAEE